MPRVILERKKERKKYLYWSRTKITYLHCYINYKFLKTVPFKEVSPFNDTNKLSKMVRATI